MMREMIDLYEEMKRLKKTSPGDEQSPGDNAALDNVNDTNAALVDPPIVDSSLVDPPTNPSTVASSVDPSAS